MVRWSEELRAEPVLERGSASRAVKMERRPEPLLESLDWECDFLVALLLLLLLLLF